MIKNIITSRNADYSTFLHCDCGNEILWFYYYHGTSTCEEIIALDYFGNLKNTKYNNSYKHFVFDVFLFNKFVKDLISAQTLETFHSEYYNGYSYLVLEKDKNNFYNIYSYVNKEKMIKENALWDISMREFQLTELINELKNMQKIIIKNN